MIVITVPRRLRVGRWLKGPRVAEKLGNGRAPVMGGGGDKEDKARRINAVG